MRLTLTESTGLLKTPRLRKNDLAHLLGKQQHCFYPTTLPPRIPVTTLTTGWQTEKERNAVKGPGVRLSFLIPHCLNLAGCSTWGWRGAGR